MTPESSHKSDAERSISPTTQWYDENAEKYAEQMEPYSEAMNEFESSLPENATVLDAGCGGGSDTHLFSEKGYQAVGLDLSEGILKAAHEKYPDDHFILGDLRNLPLPEDSFDGVWSRASLLHMETTGDVQKALVEFHRILRPEGLLFVLVRAKTDQQERPVIESNSAVERHFQYFTPEQMQTLVTNAGFEIAKIEKIPESERRAHGRPEVQQLEVWAVKSGD